MRDMREQVPSTAFLSFDTEFPGALKPRTKCIDEWTNTNSTVRDSSPIQFGFTFYGFDVLKDQFNPEGIAFLQEHGFDLDRHRDEGVSHEQFRRFFFNSGLFYSSICWVTFYGNFDLNESVYRSMV
ncbi:probable CCR4-associated factor 1 homolog 11 [Trichogramma pretiosum]|uniref:probable CCR4-associated factor 1 homolog 11 n=1 Tax=Trichogramma pretiosum TaxID=7493 RepID=UPI000C71BE81|nr:probable CCR4-associated factor 1 homolog 11 [Trichogramma pretiosum]